MSGRIGKYEKQSTAGEAFDAYIPPKFPVDPPIDLESLSLLIEKATLSLGEVNRISKDIPNHSLFLHMYIRKEALLSSQIEGTQSSFSDLLLFENNQKPSVSEEDVEEVTNYVKAIKHGIDRINSGFPLSLRLIKEIHKILLSGSRGKKQSPGDFRVSQNWIGGTRPGNAIFVPPPAHKLPEILSEFEAFLHSTSLPTVIKTGLAHIQFETIHPFLDGNGRLGRLLIVLMFVHDNILVNPILYISLYLKRNRNKYYELLQEVRLHGSWETWLEFFLNAVIESSKALISDTKQINELFEKDISLIGRNLGRARFTCLEALNLLKILPQMSVVSLSEKLEVSKPSARKALQKMEDLGIVEEFTLKQRDKVYVYREYLNILEKEEAF